MLATAVQLLRQPHLATWSTVWAEDGAIYTTDALSHPAWTTIWRGYAGYTQVLARVLALGTRLVPPSSIAAVLAVSAALVTSLLGLAVVWWSQGWICSRLLRWVLGAMVVAAPITYSEINASVVNLGWPLVVASFWAIAARDRSRPALAGQVAVVVVAALTTSVAFVLVPWAMAVAAVRRRRGRPGGGGGAGRGPGSPGSRLAERRAGAAAPAVRPGTRGAAVRGAGAGLAGHRRALAGRPLGAPRGGARTVSVAAVLAVMAAARPWRLDRGHLGVALGALVVGTATFVATVWLRGAAAVGLTTPDGHFDNGGSRYSYVAIVLIFGGLAVMVDRSGRHWLKTVLAAQAVLVMATSLTLGGYRSLPPSWPDGVARASQECRDDPAATSVAVQVAPGPAWQTVLPCDRLR